MGMAWFRTSGIPTALVTPCPMSIAARVVKWLLRPDMDVALLSQLGGAGTDLLYQLFW